MASWCLFYSLLTEKMWETVTDTSRKILLQRAKGPAEETTSKSEWTSPGNSCNSELFRENCLNCNLKPFYYRWLWELDAPQFALHLARHLCPESHQQRELVHFPSVPPGGESTIPRTDLSSSVLQCSWIWLWILERPLFLTSPIPGCQKLSLLLDISSRFWKILPQFQGDQVLTRTSRFRMAGG
jgi:hypothetical protein